MEPEAKSEQEGAAESGSGVEREGEGEAGRKLDSQRVEQLSRFLRHQQEVVYRQENVAKYFSPALQKVASKCWEQIHPNISSAIEGKYGRVLEEWNVPQKLTELDRQQRDSSKATPTWRPTGIPQEDGLAAELTEASLSLPDFQARLTEAEERSCDLQRQVREREVELAELDQEINSSLASLKHITSSFPLPSSPSSRDM